MKENETRQKIILGASKLFVKHGCKKITMDRISEALHISKRTIYEQFEDKSELLKACIDHYFALASEALYEDKNNGVEPLFITMVMLRHMTEFPKTHERVFNDIETYYPKVKAYYYEVHFCHKKNLLITELQAAKARGLIRQDANLDIAAHSMLHFIRMMRRNDLPIEMPKMGMVAENLFTYMRGLLTLDGLALFEKDGAAIKQLFEESKIKISRSCMAKNVAETDVLDIDGDDASAPITNQE